VLLTNSIRGIVVLLVTVSKRMPLTFNYVLIQKKQSTIQIPAKA